MITTYARMKVPVPVLGCGIGDAVGGPFEFHSMFHPIFDGWSGEFRKGGSGGGIGKWTDDTHMAIRLADSQLQVGRFDSTAVFAAYKAWLRTGDLRGIGCTCSAALHDGRPRDGEYAAGNGTAMRVCSVGLFARTLPELVRTAILDADLTHRNLEAYAGSVVVAYLVRKLAVLAPDDIEGKWTAVDHAINLLGLLGKKFACSKMRKALCLARRNARLVCNKTISWEYALRLIGTTGYVVHTVPAAVFSLLATTSFKDAVVMGVRGGNDADTTGAVVGAMAGAFYGLHGIPKEYHRVEARERLVSLDQKLAERGLYNA